MIGGTMLQTLILLWITLRTDWDKEVIILYVIIIKHYDSIFIFNTYVSVLQIIRFSIVNETKYTLIVLPPFLLAFILTLYDKIMNIGEYNKGTIGEVGPQKTG